VSDRNDASTGDLTHLVRPAVGRLPEYVPAKGAAKANDRLIRLDMNESPFGPSPRTRAALLDFQQTNRYPDFAQTALRTALSDYTGVDIEQIVCGAGLDDVFEALANLLIDPGDEVIISEPTFGVYRPLFTMHGATVVNVPLSSAFALEPDAIVAATSLDTKLVLICNPNNPTGNAFPEESVRAVIEGVDCVVAIDEAYAEFSRRTLVPLMDEYANVMILRTMSKWAGLAGMRVGYGLVPKSLVPDMHRVVPPFHNVSLASADAAIASIDDREFLMERVADICAERENLRASLNAIAGLAALPSETNFILVRTDLDDARELVSDIARAGVLVRGYGDDLLRRYFRVSVGLPDENRAFLAALNRAMESRHEA
jgi:histidinol-phosphate aminotransferase